MTNKQSLNGVRSTAIETHPATAARPLRALVMQEMYGEDADKALAQLRQLWADRHGLKLDIRHTAELPPYRQDDLYWDLLVWQTTARPADAAPQERRRDAAKLERRTRWLAQWANEWPGRLVVIDDPETFDKVRAIGRTRHEVRLENVIAGDDEPPGGWLAAKRREARDTVWIIVGHHRLGADEHGLVRHQERMRSAHRRAHGLRRDQGVTAGFDVRTKPDRAQARGSRGRTHLAEDQAAPPRAGPGREGLSEPRRLRGGRGRRRADADADRAPPGAGRGLTRGEWRRPTTSMKTCESS